MPKEIFYDNVSKRVRVQTVNKAPSKTQQQFADQCDVNKIIAKYKTTGEFQHIARKQGYYADVSEIGDYQQALDTVLAANHAFQALPAQLRLRFNNNPQELLEFIANPNNHDEGVKLGIFEKTLSHQKLDQARQKNDDLNDEKLSANKSKKTPNPKSQDPSPSQLDEE